MTLTRRGFLASLGLAVTAVTFQGPTGLLEAAAATLDEPLRVGDLITVAGRYAVNPITRQASGQLQWFMVTSVETGRIGLHPSGPQR